MTQRPGRGPLRPNELAVGVVLADLSLALCVTSRFVPLGGALVAFGTVPIAAVASRHRLRAAVVGGLAAMVVGFLLAGFDMVVTVGVCTALGSLSGCAYRRQWGMVRTVGVGLVLFWLPGSIAALLLLLLFDDLRRLTLAQVHNTWSGVARTLRNVGLDGLARVGDTVVSWCIGHWWLVVVGGVFAVVAAGCVVSWHFGRRILGAFAPSARGADDPVEEHGEQRPGPVPVELENVTVRYPGGPEAALDRVSASFAPGEFVAVIGENGSGKSTLARVLVGRAATSGRVTRPGAAGLGGSLGSAVVFQRPEAQVLGVRVSDDLRWALPPGEPLDIDAALASVGLVGFADRETATLSGGELQRLAIAAARVRTPRLLISDEATSMLDPVGRREVMQLLRHTAAEGVTVVHITHDEHEAAAADRTVGLRAGRIVDRASAMPPIPHDAARRSGPERNPARGGLSVQGVGHTYSARTPWAHRSLHRLDLEIDAGTGVLVCGHNGSGKSTLAWILAGILVPTEGRVLLDGAPVDRHVGSVGLSFQHPRLQLLGSSVEREVCAAAGVDEDAARVALDAVGLDPVVYAERSVDQLSGGEQRRLVIAGLLARRTAVVVLDEPFAGLDHDGRARLVRALFALRRESGATLVVVSHDEGIPVGLAERVLRLESGCVVADAAREHEA